MFIRQRSSVSTKYQITLKLGMSEKRNKFEDTLEKDKTGKRGSPVSNNESTQIVKQILVSGAIVKFTLPS